MGQYLFRLPDIGEGVAEAEITAWHVKPGDHIQEDAPLLDNNKVGNSIAHARDRAGPPFSNVVRGQRAQ